MITQDQYNALCARAAVEPDADLADLLESFEILHAVLDGLCKKDARPGLDAFEALTNSDGTARVELVCRGKGARHV